MNILFIHPNFPAQFRHLSEALASNPKNRVVFLCSNPRPEWEISGVQKATFEDPAKHSDRLHPLTQILDAKYKIGEAAFHRALSLKKEGFTPDLMIAHSGWGSSLFIREIFPKAACLSFFEWFYDPEGANAQFGDSAPLSPQAKLPLRVRNSDIQEDLIYCDRGYTPTHWQAKQFPAMFREKIEVVHDGVDIDYFTPLPREQALQKLNQHLKSRFQPDDELVTYIARGMEPYRGFPQFMEAVPRILAERPKAQILIVGKDQSCYGPPPAQGGTWKELMLKKIAPLLSKEDLQRLHFVGSLPYGALKTVYQASHAHVYLSRPFVLSWSVLESMSCEGLLLGSSTEPVTEVIQHEENGLLFDFFSPEDLAKTVVRALQEKDELLPLRKAARKSIEANYALKDCLKKQIALVQDILSPQ